MITGATLAAAVTVTLNVPFVEPTLLVAAKVKSYVPGVVLEDGLNTATPFVLNVPKPDQFAPVAANTGVGFPL